MLLFISIAGNYARNNSSVANQCVTSKSIRIPRSIKDERVRSERPNLISGSHRGFEFSPFLRRVIRQ